MKPLCHHLRFVSVPMLLALAACASASPGADAPPVAEGLGVGHPGQEAPVAPGAPAAPTASAPAVTPACSPLGPRAVPLEVAVLPEAGATPFVTVLGRAKTSIRVM